jgi:carbamoyltransferase
MLYEVEYGNPHPRLAGRLFPYYATLYGVMNYYAGPLRPEKAEEHIARNDNPLGYSWPGKIMSWIRAGSSTIEAVRAAAEIFDRAAVNRSMAIISGAPNEHAFMAALTEHFRAKGYDDRQLLSLVHDVIGHKLLEGLERLGVHSSENLIFTGGAALNIKWNSLLRERYRALWVPPCPNDSGSALGAAACHAARNGVKALNWDVYCGHLPIENGSAREGWECLGESSAYSLALLILSEPDEPIVFLNGRAELGPRALGNRSIIANPSNAAMKDKLNTAKRREPWRPVAPICLETRARSFFSPGTTDPYMLFDHKALPVTMERAPAIVHEDGTARLQTINRKEHPLITDILEAMDSIAGLPIVCNTSANFSGRGFFPDISSAMEWCEQVGFNYVFCNGKLYKRCKR